MKRWIYKGTAAAFLGLGTLGAVLPLLPTVPFWILAAILFLKSDPAAAERIFARPEFGPMVEQFVRHGVISRAAKQRALAGVAVAGAIGLYLVWDRPLIAAVQIVGLTFGAAYVASRPERQAAPAE